jgi:hypothetical protein
MIAQLSLEGLIMLDCSHFSNSILHKYINKKVNPMNGNSLENKALGASNCCECYAVVVVPTMLSYHFAEAASLKSWFWGTRLAINPK